MKQTFMGITFPSWPLAWICSQHMIKGHQMTIAHCFRCLCIVANNCWVRPDFVLWEGDSYLHLSTPEAIFCSKPILFTKKRSTFRPPFPSIQKQHSSAILETHLTKHQLYEPY